MTQVRLAELADSIEDHIIVRERHLMRRLQVRGITQVREKSISMPEQGVSPRPAARMPISRRCPACSKSSPGRVRFSWRN